MTDLFWVHQFSTIFNPRKPFSFSFSDLLSLFHKLFWLQKCLAIIAITHPPQGPETEVHHRIPSSLLKAQKTNVSFTLHLPDIANKCKTLLRRDRTHIGGPYSFCIKLTLIFGRNRKRRTMADLIVRECSTVGITMRFELLFLLWFSVNKETETHLCVASLSWI